MVSKNLKVGAKVRVLTKRAMARLSDERTPPDPDHQPMYGGTTLLETMALACGRVGTITGVWSNGYSLRFDDVRIPGFSFSVEMLTRYRG
jgi:hypothetical protein